MSKVYDVENCVTGNIYTIIDTGVCEDLIVSWPDYGHGAGQKLYKRVEVLDHIEGGIWRLAEDKPTLPSLGVYRPELETRKVGKVRVELLDDGFPLALREIAKVMTWAQDAKGYKDHDWQNLPNAEVALAAAASRHRTDHIKQRVVEGLPIEQCVDTESNLLHKAHEAFGVLAQLELMLRGDIA
ncbi:hypothetical protein PHB09_103 [Pseudomonas phage PHB09]|uniref:dATP/dGTP diphosphohydrolase N-terminal domain-containing protein n=1 Tax=Pseudomonas phage PHB09 TaxID=2867265 RepID=A0AAE9BMS1_9CAUD|nr:hypothetical protein QGX10_gp102 [Pseudomonas phage PHB09]UAV84598.1 hypothetical protein PHB09_103 [Pseudomonas phage PHB09]